MPRHHVCLVCDYPHLSEPPRSEFGGGSFEICPACGFQFGVNDDDEGIDYNDWRKRWEAKGMPWSSFAIPQPAQWHPVAKFVKPAAASANSGGEKAAPAAKGKTGSAPATETATAEKRAKAAKRKH